MVIVIALAAVVLTAFPVAQPAPASAADLSKFDPANIISDDVFYNGNTMNAAQVQSFLESKVAACAPGNVCMRNLVMDTPSRDGDSYCKAYNGASRETAAQILVKVSQACGINPQVLIVLLQKEQGLITKSAPGPLGSYAWERATGYACPDTAACDTRYFGYFNQLYSAARQFKLYGNTAWFTRYPVGKPTQIQWHPNVSCGTGTVTIKNKATAALYYYTPYQPNAAAIAAGYGVGDSCSTYGNRNFYQYFVDWFGSTQGGPSLPIGYLDSVSATSGLLSVRGWTRDPNSDATMNVQILINGAGDTTPANTYRPDVGAHAYEMQIPVLFDGPANVCAYGINPTSGGRTELGCMNVNLPAGNPPELGRAPFGFVDSVSVAPGTVKVRGWSIDPDTLAPIAVHVYVGANATAFTANVPRSDIGGAYPKYGVAHGFDATITGVSGTQNVCAYAIDSAKTAANTLLGCQTVTIPEGVTEQGRAPIGNFESITAGPGTVQVVGWAIDPDTIQPIAVHVYVDSNGYPRSANRPRSDVGSAYPLYGPNHGFNETLTVSKGPHNVCIYAIDSAGGNNTALGCKTVNVPSPVVEKGRAPMGAIDSISVTDGVISARGWAIDPDTEDPIRVHMYVGGAGQAFVANASRPDVARVYPDYGPNHGYNTSMSAQPGTYQVCMYAIDSIGGPNTTLGCNTVVVPKPSPPDTRAPFGYFESVTPVSGGFQVAGWAIDPKSPTTSIAVHVYSNGSAIALSANQPRSDVAAAYPGSGAAHGFNSVISVPAGTYQVCAYAINTKPGDNPNIGCRAVTVG